MLKKHFILKRSCRDIWSEATQHAHNNIGGLCMQQHHHFSSLGPKLFWHDNAPVDTVGTSKVEVEKLELLAQSPDLITAELLWNEL